MKNEDVLNQIVEKLQSKIYAKRLVPELSVTKEYNYEYPCGNFFIAGKSYPFCSLMLNYKGDIDVFLFPISESVAFVLCAPGRTISPKLSIEKNFEDYYVHQFDYNEEGEREVKHFICKSLLELVDTIYELLETRIKASDLLN